MSIKMTDEVITTTQEPKTNTYSIHPPLGEQPEGNLDALDKLDTAIKSLFKNLDQLQENINKLTAENQRLKDALGIVESPLVLTEDMEVKDGH
jgi:DNA-directed RNA polymerase subunit L